MAIYVVDGKIGSGKTYYCVYHLLRKYYEFDEVLNDYLPRRDIVIVTNINRFRPDHVDLRDSLEKRGLHVVFSFEFVEEIRKEYGCRQVIYVIDEAQTILGRKFYDQEVFKFFQKCRHEGIDIFLVTQDIFTMSRELHNLAEETIHAVSRSHRSAGVFRYKRFVDGESTGGFLIRVDKKIFRWYKSQSGEESEKPAFAYKRFILLAVALFIFAVVGFRLLFVPLFGGKKYVPSGAQAQAATKNKLNEKEIVQGRPLVPPRVVEYRDLAKGKVQGGGEIVVPAPSGEAVIPQKSSISSSLPVSVPPVPLPDMSYNGILARGLLRSRVQINGQIIEVVEIGSDLYTFLDGVLQGKNRVRPAATDAPSRGSEQAGPLGRS